ncbi:MAG: hypothetical protein F6J96_36350 [Symploca sp. SIO1C2]|nr:hypothetical protein [Symploca sp. SIO1C2]
MDQLAKVIGNHPAFNLLSELFSRGMPFCLTRELSEEEREAEVAANLQRGNHKSAMDEIEKIRRLLEKEVRHGFSIVVPKSTATRIKGVMIQPCGMANQFSLKADGSRKLKHRLTHDLSFSITSRDASVNSRLDMFRYPEMVYGWCLMRIIHFIVTLRCLYPGVKIWIKKFDYSDAYRRITHQGRAASQCVLVVDDTAYISLRLTFGGSANPPSFCTFSETHRPCQ